MTTTMMTQGKKVATSVAAAKKNGGVIQIPALKQEAIIVTIIGLTDMLQNRMTEAAIDKMEEEQTKGKGTGKQKELRDIAKEAEDHCHMKINEKGEKLYCHPAAGVRKAIVACGKRLFGEDMVKTCGLLNISAEDGDDLIPIKSEPPKMRRDACRQHNTCFLVYRPQYHAWSMRLRVIYNANYFSEEAVMNFINQAGASVGIGAWRVENKGTFGQFRADAIERISL